MNLEPYEGLVGRQVSYMRWGKQKSGKLDSIGYDDSNDTIVASIVVTKGFGIFKWTEIEKVALRQIMLPKTGRSMSHSSTNEPISSRTRSRIGGGSMSESTSIQRGQLCENYLIYNLLRYEKCTVPWLKVGEQVVWVLPESTTLPLGGVTFIGTIRFLGKREQVNSGDECVALVEFDQKTDNLPGYFSGGPNCDKNVIKIEDLVKLEDALSDNSGQRQRELWEMEPGRTRHSVESLFRAPSAPPASNDFNINSRPPPVGATISARDLIDLTEGISSLPWPPMTPSSPQPDDWEKSIDVDHFLASVLGSGQKQLFGIQGHNNSCYMDASLFSLFAFNHSLDNFISFKLPVFDFGEEKQDDKLKAVLRESIVGPLRGNYFVPSDRVHLLRNILVDENVSFRNSFVDAEDFMLTLFKLIDVPPMFQYDNGGIDHIHQILLPSSLETSRKIGVLTVQALLNGSFMTSDVKLVRPPEGLFIVKLPVSDGVLIPCERVVPDLSLDLTEILAEGARGKGGKRTPEFNLSAVICFHKSHYVALVRIGKDVFSPWIFMDSCPATGKPQVTVLKYTGRLLMELLNSLHHGKSDLPPEIPEEEMSFVRRITTDAYICIYDC